jgi:hypothetical protein
MPCDTWWNPFCCAMEVCADMFEEMISMMMSGVDAMMEMCEGVIDEIGKLADDIVETEEQIVIMGEDIGLMADCIVVFIDESTEFVESFCPNTNYNSHLSGKSLLKSDVSGEYCGASLTKISTRNIEEFASKNSKSSNDLSIKINSIEHTFDLVRERLDQNWSVLFRNQANVGVGDNPFGEFADMVTSMSELCSSMVDMFEAQRDEGLKMLSSLENTMQASADLDTAVVDMSRDIKILGGDISAENELLSSLSSCPKP